MNKEIKPILEAKDDDKSYPKEFVHEMLIKLQPFGYLGSVIPTEQHGGAGFDYLSYGY